MNLSLIGYRGSGKSSVGRELSDRLGWPFVDTDDLIEARAGKTIREIFAEQGEPWFRDLEAQVIADVLEGTEQVVSLGGGAILRSTTRTLVRERGPVIWLRGSVAELARRLALDTTSPSRRPTLTGQGLLDEIEHVLKQREPLYRAAATLTVDTDQKGVSELAQEILQTLQLL